MATEFGQDKILPAAPSAGKRTQLGQQKEEDAEIKHVLTGEAYGDHREIILLEVMKPLNISLQVFGLLWTSKSNMFRKGRCNFDWCTLHCCMVLIFAWSNVARYFARYGSSETYGHKLLRNVASHIFDFQFAFGLTTSVYFMQKHIPHFVKIWENYKIKHGGVSFAKMRRNIMVRVVASNIMAFIIIVGTVSVGLIIDHNLYTEHHLPLLSRLKVYRPLWLTVLISLMHCYIGIAWIQCLVLCVCLNKNLKDEFLQLSSQFGEEINGLKSVPSLKVNVANSYKTQYTFLSNNKNQSEHYRQRFMELCTLVSMFDDIISSYLLSMYFFSIPLIVILLYLVWGFEQGSLNNMAMYWSSLVSVTFYIIFIIIVTMSSSAVSGAVSTKISSQ